MQSAVTSQDQMQNVMKDLLQEVHSSLKNVLKHCLQQVAVEMFNKNLISQSVKDDPTYDKMIDEFVAGMKWKGAPELQHHWQTFLKILSSQGGPVCDAAKHLATELSDKLENELSDDVTPSACNSSTSKDVRNVKIYKEDEVLKELQRLQRQFARLRKQFKNELKEKVKDTETLEELTDYVLNFIPTAYEEFSNIKNLNELFNKLHRYFDFLDCQLIVEIAAEYVTEELSKDIQEHSKQAANFRSSQSIEELRDCLMQIYNPHLKNPENAPKAHIKLNKPWNQVNIEGLYLLIKHFLPQHEKQSLINHITISAGSVLIKYIVRESQIDYLIAYAQDKLQFMRLIGMFGLVINDTPILTDEDENDNFTFDVALLEAAKVGHIEAVQFLLELGANVNIALLKALQDDQIEAISVLMELGGNIDDALLEATKHGQTEAAQLLLELGACVDTALLKAVQVGQNKAVLVLMELGGNIDDALLEVAKVGNSEAVCLLLKYGARINHQNENGLTPLMLATLGGHEQVVQTLVTAGADINIQESEGWTALMIASENGQTQVIELVKEHAHFNIQTNDGWTALMIASLNGHIKVIELLIKTGANVNIQGKNGVTALMLASQNGHTDVSELLLKANANVSIQDEDRWTALMIASQNGHTHVVEKLLKQRPDVNIQTKEGVTALMLASQNGHTNVSELLLKANANVSIQDEDRWTALMIASQNGHTHVVEKLLKQRPDVNIQTKEGVTALMLASQNGHTNVSELLLKANANVSIQDEDGWTALMLASQNGHAQVVEQLKEHSDINIQAKEGVTGLMLASQNGHTKVIETILKEHVDIDAQKEDGSTALMLACHNGHVEVAEHLLQSYANPHIIAYNGATALSLAAYSGNRDLVNMLLDKAEPTTEEIEKAVVTSCYGGHTTIITFLFNKLTHLTNDQRELLDSCVKGDLGAVIMKILGSPDTPLVFGLTPLMVASSCGHVDIVDALIQAGADVNKQESHFGFTPLFFAVKGGQTSLIVERLLMHGASPYVIANTDETPLDVAMDINETSEMNSIIELLNKHEDQTILQLHGTIESYDLPTSLQMTHKVTDIKPFEYKGDTIKRITKQEYQVSYPSFIHSLKPIVPIHLEISV